MERPDYLVCLECETPCYTFETLGPKITEILCTACGNEDVELFATPEEFEEMSGPGGPGSPGSRPEPGSAKPRGR